MSPDLSQHAEFPPTHWTLVRAVQGESEEEAARAMDELCRSYWYPIYAFLRRTGRSVENAEDLTQAFFQILITDDALRNARPEAGKLRSWLLAMLKRMLSDETRHEATLKRGGGVVHVSFDELGAEERYVLEPLDNRDPEWLYTRVWAHELLDGVREELRRTCETTRPGIFPLLLPFLMLEDEAPPHRGLAQEIGCSEAASRILIHRLRVKYRALLHHEIGKTVSSPEEIPEEMAWLMRVLANQKP